ncbi:MAG TPA: signal peptidase II [Candidatus Dormibacteraeota bacterium]|nr:signal peptidase II [Candidatus Dormibacteraeota bacterium]
MSPGQLWFALVAVAVVVLDRISKVLVQAYVAPGREVQVLPHLWIANTHNSGAAFGLAPQATLLFLVASVLVSGGLLLYAVRTPMGAWTGAVLGLVMGGTVGNGYDRLVHGTVTDFIALHFWPVFNLADSAISVGVVLLLAGYLRRARRDD